MRAWLSRAGVPFIAKNVEEDDRAYDELLALGLRAVPVTLIGGRVVRGYDPDAFEAALAQAVQHPESPDRSS